MDTTPAPRSPGSRVTVFDLWDERNPRAIVNIVPPKISELLRAAYLKEPGLFGLGERETKLQLRTREESPTVSDNRIRLNFWLEYESAQHHLKPMTVAAIIRGLCSTGYLEKYLTNPGHVAWMLTPPASYEVVVEEALQYGMEKMRDVLEMDEMLPNGQPNLKLIEIKAKIVTMLDVRLKGLPTQRVEQRSLTYNLNEASRDAGASAEAASMAQLQERLKELERRERRALNLPDPPKDPAPAPAAEKAPIDAEFKPA